MSLLIKHETTHNDKPIPKAQAGKKVHLVHNIIVHVKSG